MILLWLYDTFVVRMQIIPEKYATNQVCISPSVVSALGRNSFILGIGGLHIVPTYAKEQAPHSNTEMTCFPGIFWRYV